MISTKRAPLWAFTGVLTCALAPLPLLAEGAQSNTASTKTASEESRVSVEGVLMLDVSQFDGVYGEGEEQTESQVRRATLGLSAELTPIIDLELSAKLEDGLDDAEVKDALLSWKISKRQRLMVGRQKEPVGLENNQSSKKIAAIERSMASALFTPDRHTGLLFSTGAPRHSIAIGVFEADDDLEDSGLAVSGRVTGAILKDDIQTVHLGTSASVRDMGGSSLKLKDEGGVNSAANIVKSSRYDVDRVQTVALEAAWLRGPLSVQAEWFQSDMQLAEDEPDPSYSGGYIQGAWLFGNAKRRYRNGAFKLSNTKGSSAWEAVLHAGYADLADDDGGTKAETLMAGLNYYKGKHLRVMGSLITADTSGPDVTDDPSGKAVTLRLQYAF